MNKWKPKIGEIYYIPWLYDYDADYIDVVWNGSSFDDKKYVAGFVCRIRAEALELAEKMLAVAEEHMQNDQRR